MVKRLKNNLSKRRTRQNTLRRKSTRRKSVRRNNRTLRRKSFKRLKGGGWIYHGKCHRGFGKKGPIDLDSYPNIAGMRGSVTDKTEYKLAIEARMGKGKFHFAESPWLRYSQILSMFKKGKKYAASKASAEETPAEALLNDACAKPYDMLDKFGPTKYIGKISKDKCEKRLEAIQRAMDSLTLFTEMLSRDHPKPLESALEIFNFDKILVDDNWEFRIRPRLGKVTDFEQNPKMGETDYR